MIMYGIMHKPSGNLVNVSIVEGKFRVGVYIEHYSVYMVYSKTEAWMVLQTNSCFCNDTLDTTPMSNGDYEIVSFNMERA